MSSLSPTSIDNLGNGMSRGSNFLEVNGEDTKEQNLNCCTARVPTQKERSEGANAHNESM